MLRHDAMKIAASLAVVSLVALTLLNQGNVPLSGPRRLTVFTPARPQSEDKAPRPQAAAPSSAERLRLLNAKLRSKGVPSSAYSVKILSSEAPQRQGGACDIRLARRDKEPLVTVRPDAWADKPGVVNASKVVLMAPDPSGSVHPTSLASVLARAGHLARYTGLDSSADLSAEPRDDRVLVRFQTAFLPAGDGAEFAPEATGCPSRGENQPRAALLMSTAAGLSLEAAAAGPGPQQLLEHRPDSRGSVHRHWLQAKPSDPQNQVPGGKSLGSGTGAVLVAQVPLAYQPTARESLHQAFMADELVPITLVNRRHRRQGQRAGVPTAPARDALPSPARTRTGSEQDVVPRAPELRLERDDQDFVRVTLTLYRTISQPFPTDADVAAAVDDLERLYAGAGAAHTRVSDRVSGLLKTALAPEQAAMRHAGKGHGADVWNKAAILAAGTFPMDLDEAAPADRGTYLCLPRDPPMHGAGACGSHAPILCGSCSQLTRATANSAPHGRLQTVETRQDDSKRAPQPRPSCRHIHWVRSHDRTLTVPSFKIWRP
eukprot:CAMPEP_0206000080 /NCGR_PEP_ID=MMETSP1464-20131121/1234_1 /ASSEMBLY_ACC=CAM_ASM_001124 /TAXON_ID=119497 /ORGANISM="Exanthemachrysis gayraliae, Strain RCC1523" /LENGTH=544 /DNA_ID=CAMNT_0053373317 /DNA_START=1 /DNA_END=1633 /DNA_ORIENTATION=+